MGFPVARGRGRRDGDGVALSETTQKHRDVLESEGK